MSNILAGFESPVHDGQQCFRLILEALSRPGRAQCLPYDVEFGSLNKAITQVLLTLSDQSSSVWLPAGTDSDPVTLDNLRFHAGCPVIEDKANAEFAVVNSHDEVTFSDFAFGDESYPDKSTTVLIAVEGFDEGVKFQLKGPGIKDSESISVKGLSEGLVVQLLSGRGEFPLGIDVILTSGNQIVAIPRSVTASLVKEDVCTSQ